MLKIGQKMLAESGLKIAPASTMDEAAQKDCVLSATLVLDFN